MMKKYKVIAIAGPTASGKTKLAIEMAQQLDTEIISADSRLVYKGFDIGTAKPSMEERNGIPHYLIDIVEPEFDYSVAQFVKDAQSAIFKVNSSGKLPVIVGGTGLYLKGLLEGYTFPDMQVDYDLRAQLNNSSAETLYSELSSIDPQAALNIDKNDKKKIVRALEIVKTLKHDNLISI